MILTVIQGTVLSPDEICGIVLGDNCATPFDPLEMWNITISDKPKPPVRPHVRPKVHRPDLVLVLPKVYCPDLVLVLPKVHCPDLVLVLLQVHCPDSVLVLPTVYCPDSVLVLPRYTVLI